MTDTTHLPDLAPARHTTFITEEEFATAMAGQIWLVSHGGCASEKLFAKLGLSYPAINVRGRPLRGVVSHLNRPMAGPEKCIYLYGSPVAAVISQLRRGHYDNARKLKNKTTYRNMHNLNDVLSTSDADPFGISAQFSAFCTDFAEYPIILLRRSALSDQFALLAEYLGLECSDSWHDAPRASKLDPKNEMHRQLVSIYGAAEDIMEQMPAIPSYSCGRLSFEVLRR